MKCQPREMRIFFKWQERKGESVTRILAQNVKYDQSSTQETAEDDYKNNTFISKFDIKSKIICLEKVLENVSVRWFLHQKTIMGLQIFMQSMNPRMFWAEDSVLLCADVSIKTMDRNLQSKS